MRERAVGVTGALVTRETERLSGTGTHRARNANVSDAQTGHCCESWISSQSRQRRATRSCIKGSGLKATRVPLPPRPVDRQLHEYATSERQSARGQLTPVGFYGLPQGQNRN